jgi:hypothetical protein
MVRALEGRRQHLPRPKPQEMLAPLGTYEIIRRDQATRRVSEGGWCASPCLWLKGEMTRAHRPYSHRMLRRQARNPVPPSTAKIADFCLGRVRNRWASGLPAQSRLRVRVGLSDEEGGSD